MSQTTQLTDITPYTDRIASAVYGEEVRGSIIGALKKVTDDNNRYITIKNEIHADREAVHADHEHVREWVEEFDGRVEGAEQVKEQLIAQQNMAETVCGTLNVKISDALQTQTSLTSTNEAATTTKSQLNTANTNATDTLSSLMQARSLATEINTSLTETIENAQEIKPELERLETSGGTLKADLNTAISSASSTYTLLHSADVSGAQTQNELNSAITSAQSVKTQLDSANNGASDALGSLMQARDLANETLSGLNSSITTAQTVKTGLDTSIETGNQLLEDLNAAGSAGGAGLVIDVSQWAEVCAPYIGPTSNPELYNRLLTSLQKGIMPVLYFPTLKMYTSVVGVRYAYECGDTLLVNYRCADPCGNNFQEGTWRVRKD